MNPKLMKVLLAGLVAMIIGAGVYGSLTYAAFFQFRHTHLVQNEFDRAKEIAEKENNFAPMEKLLFGPIDADSQIAKFYTPLDMSMKPEFESVKTSVKGAAKFFHDKALPSSKLGWLFLGLVVISGFVIVPATRGIFLKQARAMNFAMLMTGCFGGYFFFMVFNGIYPMGIDLAGGTELVYRLQFKELDRRIQQVEKERESLSQKIGQKDEMGKDITAETLTRKDDLRRSLEHSRDTAPDKAADVVRLRVDPNGTKGIPVIKLGTERMRIQLPKASPEDVERIKRAIATQGRLSFHLVADERNDQEIITKTKQSPNGEFGDYKIMVEKKKNRYTEQPEEPIKHVVKRDAEMEGSRVVMARVMRGQQGGYEVGITFDAAGSAQFELLTGKNVGRRMAIILDGEVKSAPNIQEKIAGECRITGNFTQKEASDLVSVLTSGSLPAEVVEESTIIVGPSLGKDQIYSGVLACLVGAGLISAFMWGYYRLCGFIALICLVVNHAVLLGALGFFQSTMTLPGLAGILLTLGMAVDANVLIFERIREEVARGRQVRLALQAGFDRAGITILDTQLTTLISALIMYYIGSGPVRGFAVTLALGILCTLFANLWVCRVLMDWLSQAEAITEFKMMKMLDSTKIDFMGMRGKWIVGSSMLNLAAFALFVYLSMGMKIYDVDFTGGSLVQFNLSAGQEMPTTEVKKLVEEKVRPGLKKTLVEVQAKLDSMITSTKNEADLRSMLVKELPYVAASQFSATTTVDVAALKDISTKIKADLEQFDHSELFTQPFGTAQEKDASKYGSFRVTTRLTDPLLTTLMTTEIKAAFAGKVRPETVSMLDDQTLRVRFDPALAGQTKDLKGRVERAMESIVTDRSRDAIKMDVLALKVSEGQEDKSSGTWFVDLAPMPKEPLTRDLVREAFGEAHMKGVAEGPIGFKNQFGPQVAGESSTKAIFAVLASMLGIFLYLWFRFDFTGAWGFGALVALVHDALLALGGLCVWYLISPTPILIDLNVIAALLTIIGYSVNDTIVVYDRIREVKSAHPTRDLGEIINEATNATLSRTILTAGTVLMACLCLVFLGGPTIQGLAFPLTIGVMVGTYSSIFIASPLMWWWLGKYGSGFGGASAKTGNTGKVEASVGNAHI